MQHTCDSKEFFIIQPYTVYFDLYIWSEQSFASAKVIALRIMSFFLSASGLGVKDLLPPYVGYELTPEDILTGVSFASGATGFDPLTPVIVV
jgi:hypothetical protein